ncbi:histidine kinase [Secundilactobacillus paracollinoides]|uniref:sensor histidine kinase n=1 Tax=Secundilactobacillus paracollinoides TaxID=240427 RepID=UPI00081A96B4|nr:sensor histidine kinase [Secundilactobacillus paracollinoides]ANZ64777.1 histidine kinase [Secundilactobacillus paracollinoides]
MFKQTRFINYGRWQRILIAAVCIALASQVNFQTYAPGFILALSPLIMPIFLYFNADLNPIQLMLAIAFASPIFRGILLFISHDGSQDQILTFIMTDIAFYLCYGALYYLLYWRRGQWNNSSFFFTIVVCDYVSNLLEASLLTHFAHYSYQLFQLLFIVALVRSLCSCLLAFLYHHFTLMMREDSHEQRYYHFVWIAASVKSEVYFMKKNISEIENVMKNAYLLNQNLQDESVDPKNRDMALSIARDVHEIKKDYQNVIRGLGDYFDDGEETAMKFTDILRVVTSYIRVTIKDRQQNIVINVQNDVELVVPNHYYVVSVISNLIFNSIDALQNKTNGLVRVTAEDAGDNIIVNISDNGSGMDAKTMAMIFQPGFTTKFNEDTGDVYRGIGLSHVKIIVQEQFDGTIEVASKLGQGNNFKVTFNKQRLLQEATA